MRGARAIVLCLLCAAHAIELRENAGNAAVQSITLGVVIPVHNGPGGAAFKPFQKIGAAILLAIHHVNSRDGYVVGDNTLRQLPEGLKLRFRLADTYYDSGPAVNALLSWMYDMEEKGSCLTGGGAGRNATQLKAPLHPYEATSGLKGIDAVVGAFSSEVTQATAVIASLQNLPSVRYRTFLLSMGLFSHGVGLFSAGCSCDYGAAKPAFSMVRQPSSLSKGPLSADTHTRINTHTHTHTLPVCTHSMASTATALGAKDRFPHFLRTVPAITTNRCCVSILYAHIHVHICIYIHPHTHV
jgi:hypothetical protein